MVFGLLNVNKPPGITSRDVVNKVQRLIRPTKVGHAGTLDPLATGVLVLCLGPATRLIQYVQRMPKRYRGTFLLGRSSETEDIEGTVVEVDDAPVPAAEQIEAALPEFIGQIQQRPPAYSALKVNGRRAYDLARQGQAPELAPRPIQIHTLGLVGYAYPELQLDIACGSGTYVRSLGRDLAARLGTSAVMSALVRTGIGPFSVETAVEFETLDKDVVAQARIAPRQAIAEMPTRTLDRDQLALVRNGQFIDTDNPTEGDEIAALDQDGELKAILIRRGPAQWGALMNFVTS